jgi:3-oxoacyl-[acyl-carrier protein] reductase
MKLEGRTAVITGGGSGQGRATAKLFAREGAKVVAVDVNRENAEQTVTEIRSEGYEQVLAMLADISNEDDVKTVMEKTVEEFGTIDILVNCAGKTGPPGKDTAEELTMDDWMSTINVNVIGPWLCTKYAAPVMREKGKGVIINVSSTAGVRAIPGASPYCATKAAVSMLTKATALEYIPYGIRVNGVLPGHIDTPMMDGVIKGMEENGLEDAYNKVHYESNPIRRLGTPEEVASIILFLASDDSSFVVGSEIYADGGFAAG